MSSTWTKSDPLLGDLVHRHRVVAPEQFGNRLPKKRVLEAHARGGRLRHADLAAVPVRDVELLHVHQPMAGTSDWDAVSRELARRWSQHEPITVRVYWAAPRTIRLLGGCMPGRLTQLDAVTHDLGVAAIAQKLFRENHTLREAWVPEEQFGDVFRQAKPDAALGSRDGLQCFVEFAGRYTSSRLQKLAALADGQRIPLLLFTISKPEIS